MSILDEALDDLRNGAAHIYPQVSPESLRAVLAELDQVRTDLEHARAAGQAVQHDRARMQAELNRQRPVLDAALALHGCGTANVWPRVGDVLDAGLAYMKDDEHLDTNGGPPG